MWTAQHLANLAGGQRHRAPVIERADPVPLAGDIGIWDAWPIHDPAGAIALFAGGRALWLALGAPRSNDPDERHGRARIHLVLREAGAWRYLGPLLPDGFSPGSREWSGSAVLDAQHVLTLYFTATGRRGETTLTFEQRLFSARATLVADGGDYRFGDWRDCREIVARDPDFYMAGDEGGGAIGTIKAFRDPFYFRDPNDAAEHMFFSGSSARAPSAFNGVVGVAVKDGSAAWRLRPPLISAAGLNNELERPHVVYQHGYYYLFWSTQSHVFNPEGSMGPTGLYGMASPSLRGGWAPLNGTGLVFANPIEAPRQAYSWLVLPDLTVTSFADELKASAGKQPPSFAGSFAPFLKLRLDGLRAWLVD